MAGWAARAHCASASWLLELKPCPRDASAAAGVAHWSAALYAFQCRLSHAIASSYIGNAVVCISIASIISESTTYPYYPGASPPHLSLLMAHRDDLNPASASHLCEPWHSDTSILCKIAHYMLAVVSGRNYYTLAFVSGKNCSDTFSSSFH